MYQFGSQFDNTYTLVPRNQDGDSAKPFDQNNEIKIYSHPQWAEARALGIPVPRAGEEQGMLFPPEHYTRTRMDPTVDNHSQQIEELFDWGRLTKKDKDNVVRQMHASTLSLDQFKNPENLSTGIVVKLTERDDAAGGYRNKNPEMRTNEPNELYINPSYSVNPYTVSHELGHRMHHSANVANNRSLLSWTEVQNRKNEKYRPLAEGVADAIADRHGSRRAASSDTFETPRHSSGLDYRLNRQQRVTDLESKNNYGYGIDFSEWDNDIDKALYGVTRLHVGLHGEKALENLPSIDQLNWEYNYTKDTPSEYGKANHRMAKYLALGKIVHENKELENVFSGTPHSKFSGTLSRAANAYRTHLENLSIANETYTPEQKQKHAVFAPYTAAKPGRLNHIRMIPEVDVNQEALPGILESLPKRKMKPIKIDASDKPAPKPKPKPRPSQGMERFFRI